MDETINPEEVIDTPVEEVTDSSESDEPVEETLEVPVEGVETPIEDVPVEEAVSLEGDPANEPLSADES